VLIVSGPGADFIAVNAVQKEKLLPRGPEEAHRAAKHPQNGTHPETKSKSCRPAVAIEGIIEDTQQNEDSAEPITRLARLSNLRQDSVMSPLGPPP
jgi:hypothetical protein